MNEMTVFQNPEFGQLRTTTIDGEPWWVGKDVAVALGYAKPRNAINAHTDDEDRKDAPIQGTPGGTQTMTIINESGLYSLILSSKLPSAKRFKRWVTSEVLPAIRKTGKYAAEAVDRLTPDDYIRAAGIVAKCNDRRLPVALKLLESAGIDVSLLMSPAPPTPTEDEPKVKRIVQYGMERVTPEEMAHLQSVLRRYTVRGAAKLVGLNHGLIGFYRSGKRLPTVERYRMIISILE